MGYNRTWPPTIWYGTHNYGELELKNPSAEAVIKKIKYTQFVLQKNTSKSINLMISWYQKISGLQ